MGQMTPDDSLVLPARLQKRSWQGKAQVAAEPVPGMAPALQMGLAGIGLVLVVGLVLFFVFGNVMKPAGQATTQAAARRWDTETPVPSQTVVLAAAAGTKPGLRPNIDAAVAAVGCHLYPHATVCGHTPPGFGIGSL
jgi:hypothetical protein